MLDITERKEAEDQLREAEEKFRTIVEQNQAIFYTQDIDPDDPAVSRTTYIAPGNPTCSATRSEDVLADPTLWRAIVHPDDRERVFEADAESNLVDGDAVLHGIPDDQQGRPHRLGRRTSPLLVQIEGRPPFWQGFLLDITERKQAEEQLARALDVEREADAAAARARRDEEHVPAGRLARPADAARGDPRPRDHARSAATSSWRRPTRRISRGASPRTPGGSTASSRTCSTSTGSRAGIVAPKLRADRRRRRSSGASWPRAD